MKKLLSILFLFSFIAFLSCNSASLKDKENAESGEKLENIINEESDSTLIQGKKADMDSVMNELEEESIPEEEDADAVE
ncbi:MAG: hypothetical protein PF485_05055 [Bacteroidales bacterium]|jgi:NAD(P)H-flavin reductase|nr:hypothetical protein [Bacteroidales bacterium]